MANLYLCVFGISGMMKIDWSKVEGLADDIVEAIDYYCNNVYVAPVEECYSAFIDNIGSLVDNLAGDTWPWLSEEDLRELDELNEEEWRALEKLVNKELEGKIEEILRMS